MRTHSILSLLLPTAFILASAASGQSTLRTYNGVDQGGEDHFGATACALGDVDFDGIPDYAIGAPSYLGGSEVHVYSGSTGLELYQAFGAQGIAPIGRQLTRLGDLNNDGADDFAASAHDYDPCYCPLGVRVFSGLDGIPMFDLFGENDYDDFTDDRFGNSIAGIGDVNGDGTPDLAVTAPDQVNPNGSIGKVFVFSGTNGAQLWSAQGDASNLFLGFGQLQPLGDVDGDTHEDFGVTYRAWDSPSASVLVGGWRVYSGFDGSVWNDAPGIASRTLSTVVPLGFDFDGDGQEDLAVTGMAAPNQPYLALTSRSDLWTPLAEINLSLGPVGLVDCRKDLSGDGIPDLVTHNSSTVQVRSGANLNLLHSIDGLISTLHGPSVGCVAVIGDVNTDGRSDLLIGSFLGGSNHNGQAKVIAGGDSIGTSYCHSATQNSTGQVASIQAIGSPDPAHHWLTLQANDLPPAQLGLFLASMDSGFVPNPGGSLGHLCLSGALGRFNTPSQVQFSSTSGQAALEVDLTAVPQPSGTVTVLGGQTWNFQMWYRDIGGTSNFTNAVSTDWN